MIIKIIFQQLKGYIAQSLHLANLRKRYPTCHFYLGVTVDDLSKFGRFNVLFSNVTMLNSTIGDHTFIQKDSFINCAEIGKFCSIAMNVFVGPGQHPTGFVSSHPAFYSSSQPLAKTFSQSDKYDHFKKIVIGHDVWIGQNCVVMDGVSIGTGAIVGAGAVVTKDVSDYAIVGGVPARLIKFRFDEKVRTLLLESQWWDWSDEQLKHRSHLFLEPAKFVNSIIIDKDKR